MTNDGDLYHRLWKVWRMDLDHHSRLGMVPTKRLYSRCANRWTHINHWTMR